MGGFVSRWPVRQQHDIAPNDLDADGVVRDDVVARWIDDACAAYIERCPVLRQLRDERGAELRTEVVAPPAGDSLGRPEMVVVTAGVPELQPTVITMAVRMRAFGGGDDAAFNVRVLVRLVDPTTGDALELGNDIRDELIAIEHAATHFN